MMSLRATLFVSVIVMTWAAVTSQPLTEEFLLLKVKTDLGANLNTIGAQVNLLNPVHRFRVIGDNALYFVLVNDGTLQNLVFPEAISVEQYVVQKVSDFFKTFSVDGWVEANTTLTNTKLSVVEWDYIPPVGSSMSDYNATMVALGNYYKAGDDTLPAVGYVAFGNFPPKLFYFMNPADSLALRGHAANGLDLAGGPGSNVIRVNALMMF